LSNGWKDGHFSCYGFFGEKRGRVILIMKFGDFGEERGKVILKG